MKKLFFLFLFLGTVPAFAQQTDGMSFISQTAPEKAAFAQPFDVEFALSHTPGYQVTLDEKTLPQGFGILQTQTQQDSPGTVTYHLTALPFTLGKSTFTAVNFQLKDADGQVRSALQSEPFYIQVSPVSYFKDKKFKEIRPPFTPSNLLLWTAAVLLVLFLAGGVIYALTQRRNQAKAVLPAEDKRPSNVIALSKIDALLNSGLWENKQYKLFYIELADIFREYLWRRFGVDASADTSAELLRRVKAMPALAPLVTPIKAFLSSGDLVKFARVIPTEERRNQDVTFLRQTVQSTTPPEEIKHD